MNISKNKIISDYLNAWINENINKFHKPLPSENFLVTKFKMSRGIIRNEFSKLVNKGYLISVRGSGYYINPAISFIQLYSIGEKNKSPKNIEEINSWRMKEILEVLKLEEKVNIEDYFGYQKSFCDYMGNVKIYTNSFIFKKMFKEIDLNQIKKSLIKTIFNNDISLNLSFNLCKIKPSTDFDREIFKNDQIVTPIVYGALITKDNQIIEIFERRYDLQDFEQKWLKFF